MKKFLILLSASLAGFLLAPTRAEVVIYDSNVNGLGVYTEGGLTAGVASEPPDSDGNPTLEIGGDPTSEYAKFFNPGYKPTETAADTVLLPLPAVPEQEYALSFEVYVPFDGQIDGATVITEFIRDPENDFKVNDNTGKEGDGLQKVQHHDYRAILLDPNNRDVWRSAQVIGRVPAVDLGGHPVTTMRFSITFKQIDTEGNDIPIRAYVRNIRLTTDADPGAAAATLAH